MQNGVLRREGALVIACTEAHVCRCILCADVVLVYMQYEMYATRMVYAVAILSRFQHFVICIIRLIVD